MLAIAALIFLMVFLALPALQRSQRDTARKNDVSIVAAAVNSYTSNNRGTLPTSAQLTTYVSGTSDNTTTVTVNTDGTAGDKTTTDGTVTVYTKLKCGAVTGDKVTLSAGTTRQYVTVTKLEAGNGSAYCLDS